MSELRRETCRKTGLANRKHGLTHTPTYRSWRAMRARCLSPTDKDYHKYGGKGIKICDRWSKFENFLEDMGLRPTNHTLDRFPDKYGDYKPTNCRWATPMQQSSNTRQNRNLMRWDESHSVSEWARLLNVNRKVIYRELREGLYTEDYNLRSSS